MRRISFSFVAMMLAVPLLAASPPANTGPSPAMLAPVQRWIVAFNSGKTLPEDVFTDDVVITDQFPPFVWTGKSGAHTWSQGLDAAPTNPRLKNEHVEVQPAQSFMANRANDRAAFVMPAVLTYTFDGAPNTNRAVWLFVVVNASDGTWQIAADTWTRTDG